jgi:hypothetical protein
MGAVNTFGEGVLQFPDVIFKIYHIQVKIKIPLQKLIVRNETSHTVFKILRRPEM